ncbi:MAG: molybdenum cofactor guanylyltransferase [Burkholderiaceae bacterium]|jgi:molybdopterin-guanine dinucleotide biosynthesis protein A|nr:molybdenum cofactor guanylyltransferase [Burkholderiaceae bacterium]
MTPPARFPAGQITGLVLAGGQGQRMGGGDKGLMPFAGQSLAQRALMRLAPQVGRMMISANRHLDTYRAFGVPVWPDASATGRDSGALSRYDGPLAGLLAGLAHCETPWLLAVPCDAPRFPHDLAQRLSAALDPDTEIALAANARGEVQPVFILLRAALHENLARYLDEGGRKVRAWAMRQRHAITLFDHPGDDPLAFANLNMPEDWQRLAPETAV